MKPKKLRFRELDDYFTFSERNPSHIHLETFKVLKREWTKRKKCVDIDLFEIELTDDIEVTEMTFNVLKEEWVEALQLCLEHFEEREEYEMCTPINKLLISIKNKINN